MIARASKRALDLVVAAVGLVCSLPLWLPIAAAIRLTSSGPVLHRARRSGRRGDTFTLLKFRTMRPGAGTAVTAAGDDRITSIGRVLRRTKLDELPQLINVLTGDMSIVGPRPEDPRFVAGYDDRQREVLSMRPGLLSPAILEYLDEERLLAEAAADGLDTDRYYAQTILPTKLEIDLAYVTGWTFRGDLGIMLGFPLALLRSLRPTDDGDHDDEIERVRATYKSYEGGRQLGWDLGSPGNRQIIDERDRHFRRLLAHLGSGDGTLVLELGCGVGGVMDAIGSIVPDATILGCDIQLDRLALATPRPVFAGDARRLPIADGSVDVIVASVVLSSISPTMWPAIATEVARVLRPGGFVLWYDMRLPNLFNRHVSPLPRATLRSLFGTDAVDVQPVTLLPQLSRALGAVADRAYAPLTRLRFLRSHLVGTITPVVGADVGRNLDRADARSIGRAR